MKIWRLGIWGGLSLFLAGCQEPTQIVPAVPPGADYARPLPASEGEGSQALGEQAARGFNESPVVAEATKIPLSPPTAKGETRTTKSGLRYETLKEGTGPEVKGGQTVTLHYTGTLQDGTVFDSSRQHGEPYTFIPGVSQVIKGWTEGVPGMRVGERRRLIIPPDLAYGEKSPSSKIPANATLTFEIELLRVK